MGDYSERLDRENYNARYEKTSRVKRRFSNPQDAEAAAARMREQGYNTRIVREGDKYVVKLSGV